jgi:amino-acid N-acetyltransferase
LPPDHLPEPARNGDLEAVLALVHSAGLPTAGIADAFPAGYAVVRAGSGIVAVAGLEAHGGDGLLRSVAVAPSRRGSGIARLLVEDRLHAAEAQGLGTVYLLTTTAAGWFVRLGFVEVPRAAVPVPVQQSAEFTSVCPASATCLARRLT